MDKVFTKRLSILADALEREDFDPGFKWSYNFVGTSEGCGTLGCAIGACPTVFPNHWRWREGFMGVCLIDKPSNTGGSGAVEFFGLTEEECQHIFYGGFLENDGDMDQDLMEAVTPQDVAAVIRAFLETKAAEEVNREGLD